MFYFIYLFLFVWYVLLMYIYILEINGLRERNCFYGFRIKFYEEGILKNEFFI